MKNKIFNSIKSGIGSYILLILINYIIYLLSGWTIMDQMIPGINYDFFIISIFLFLILFITDFFFYKGKH
ncbi:MAG: hypothetical protein ACJZ0Y_06000 [Cytophagales bacterium]|jgi:hypothetical protein|nr:MAG: hypothetical protein CND83_03885 [Rhodothermaeota bacterium MED-G19]